MMHSETTIFIIDDDPTTCQLLELAAWEAGFGSQTYHSAAEFLENYRPDQAGCILLDVQMPGMSGIDLQRELATRGSSLPILFVTGTQDVSVAVSAMKQGAMEFIQKPIEPRTLKTRIQEAVQADALARKRRGEHEELLGRIASLTPKEREVMDRVVAGLANKQIALQLGIGEKTVEVHRSRVMQKMQAESIAELVRLVLAAEPEKAVRKAS